ncbi:hypothetical protein ACFOSS_09425 [Pseudaeromonas sharmana]|uniref:Uncharacterized protein n=1 Tax=Pseudaeromonas sharmana TaxID=328412 RepID=A0ABV8CNA4_9GAMM
MEVQAVKDQGKERIKVVWLIKGIAKSKITLQPAQLNADALPTRVISWREGDPRPVRVPWVVARTKSATLDLVSQNRLEPQVIDMRKRVQWRDTLPRLQVSWMTRNTPAPVHDERLLTVLLPKKVSWQCGDEPKHNVSWV